MRHGKEHCGCFPVGRHYPGIADALARLAKEKPQEGLLVGIQPDTDWRSVPMVVIDFETTGLSSERDRVLEIGIVCVDEGVITERIGQLIHPGIAIPEEASKVHGIAEKDLEGAPTFGEAMAKLAHHLEGRLPVAYNAGFDRGFLLAETRRLDDASGWQKRIPAMHPDIQWLDPLVWAREYLTELRSKKLTAVAAHLGVRLDGAHRGAADAEATAEVLHKLQGYMPATYGDLMRIQKTLAAQQAMQMAQWKRRGSFDK